MSAYDFNELKAHIGHKIVCVSYGDPPANVAVECEDCNTVLLDYDRPDSSPLDMVRAREDQEEIHQVRNEVRQRQGKEPVTEDADSFLRFLDYARPLLETSYCCQPNVMEISQKRGVQTLRLTGDKLLHMPDDSEYMLTIRVGRCFHQMQDGVCIKCGTHQKDRAESIDGKEGQDQVSSGSSD